MGMIAVAGFVALFAFGENGIGWSDPQGHVQFAIFMAFVCGVISGFRSRA